MLWQFCWLRFFCRYLEGLRTPTRRWSKRRIKRHLRGTRTKRRRRSAGAAFMTQGRRCAGKNSLSIGNQETCLATGCYYFWLLAKILVILVINCGTTCLCCIYATHNWRNCQSWGRLKTNCSARRVLYNSISNTRQHITVLYCIIIFVIFTID